jgi:hypothetical protein
MSSCCYICVLILQVEIFSELDPSRETRPKLANIAACILAALADPGTQFTCFTGINVQILTPEELRASLLSAECCLAEGLEAFTNGCERPL